MFHTGEKFSLRMHTAYARGVTPIISHLISTQPQHGTYTMSMAAKMLLSCKSLATYWARKWPLSCVAPDVSFHDSLLFCSVRAERALVKFHRDNQTVTFRGNTKRNSQKHIVQNCLDVFIAKRSSFHSTHVNPPPLPTPGRVC